MPKVIVTPNGSYNPVGVRLLLGEIGVSGPMLQDETTITCMMTDDQISRFRNSRGAAHKLVIVEDAPPATVEVEAPAESEAFPQTWGKAGNPRMIAHNSMEVAAAKSAGYKRVSPDPLHEEVPESDDEPAPQDPAQAEQSTTPILDINAKKKK